MTEISEVEKSLIIRLLSEDLHEHITSLELDVLLLARERQESNGEGVTIEDITQTLGFDEGLARYIVGRLMKKGLITEGNSYHLTSRGSELLGKVDEYLPGVGRAIRGDVYFSSLLNEMVG